MRHLDLMNQEQQAVLVQLSQAMAGDDEQQLAEAMSSFANMIQNQVLQEAQRQNNRAADRSILSSRGVHVLTQEETEYYQSVREAMRSSNPKQALSDLNLVLPKTVIEMVFMDIRTQFPLLDAINFQATEGLVDMILSTRTGAAQWGDLCAEIVAELGGGFVVVPLSHKKISAFVPVCKAMLELGPEWLDRYVRAMLVESLALGLEAAIVDGDGKDKPIGMSRKLSGAVDGVYPRKDAVAITSLDAVTMGTQLATIAKTPDNKERAVSEVILVVSPSDYFTKVFPATTVRATDGSYNSNVFPFPTKVFQSPAVVPANHAVMGLGSHYFMGLGTSRGGKLEYSDEYRFLEDQRVYLIKLYGNGRATDENAFAYLNISGLKPTALDVRVTNISEFPTV
ncbi:MAG: phage major capsid protein [Christensenellales bacterium]|jgi:hypothetical protein